MIPFVDLHAQYLTIKNDVDGAIQDVIKNSYFVRGPYVDKFEQEFAELIGTKNCVSCANGTDALYIAMKGLNIKPGDEVIAPAHSWISTTETITQAGGKVVFCDTDDKTYTIDPDKIEEKITDKTVGIIPVHLFGQPADMSRIMAIADKHRLWVVEDCAQAHLAKYKGKKVGSFGSAATFSFYPGKNLGAMGDAGAIVTNDEALASRMTMFARHGGLKKGDHRIEGINSRLDGMQAAILCAKLPHLENWTALRQSAAEKYTASLCGIQGIECPQVEDGREHVWHLYVISADDRDGLGSYLSDQGISTVINYRVALPFLPAYEYLGHKPEDFPNAFRNQSRILSIPLYPEITDTSIDTVSQAISAYYERGQQLGAVS